jgi:hypothetical protein
MEQCRDRHHCAICGQRVSREARHDTLCDRCTDAWKREVDCAW